MEANNALQDLQNEWGIEAPQLVSEASILAQLAKRVVYLLDNEPDHFIRLMYRLDISEKKLAAITGQPDAAEQVARLIYDRQLQKIASRAHFRNSNKPDDDSLSW